MSKQTRKPGHNVVPITLKGKPPVNQAQSAPGTLAAAAGSAEDPRMKEALRMVEAFLAIEDQHGRTTLIRLAESMVSFDWLRNARLRMLP